MENPEGKKPGGLTLTEKCAKEREKLCHKLANGLRNDLKRLLDESLFSDLTILCEDGEIKAHQQILQVRLPELALLNEDDTIKLEETKVSEAREILRQIYTCDDVSLARELLDPYLNNIEVIPPETKELLLRTPRPSVIVDTQSIKQLESKLPLALDDSDNSNDVKVIDLTLRNDSDIFSDNSIDDGTNVCINQIDDATGENDDRTDSSPRSPDHGQPASKLGADLLQMFLHKSNADIDVRIGEQVYKAHRFILSARCSFFEAMLSGTWKESIQKEISLEGVSQAGAYLALEFLYGAIIDTEGSCSLPEIIQVADMYGIEGLKDLAGYILLKKKCHFFHKPCNECIAGVIEAMSLASFYSLTDVLDRALVWVTKHFTKVWPTKQFAAMPPDLLKSCCQKLVEDLTVDTVLSVLCGCDRVKSILPLVKWADTVVDLLTVITTKCIAFIQQNFSAVLQSQTFLKEYLEASENLDLLEFWMNKVIHSQPVSVACQSYMSARKLKSFAHSGICDWSLDSRKLTKRIEELCQLFITHNLSQLLLLPEWDQIPKKLQDKIKDEASFVQIEENKQLRPAPKLSSQNRSAPLKRAVSTIEKRMSVKPKLSTQKSLNLNSSGNVRPAKPSRLSLSSSTAVPTTTATSSKRRSLNQTYSAPATPRYMLSRQPRLAPAAAAVASENSSAASSNANRSSERRGTFKKDKPDELLRKLGVKPVVVTGSPRPRMPLKAKTPVSLVTKTPQRKMPDATTSKSTEDVSSAAASSSSKPKLKSKLAQYQGLKSSQRLTSSTPHLAATKPSRLPQPQTKAKRGAEDRDKLENAQSSSQNASNDKENVFSRLSSPSPRRRRSLSTGLATTPTATSSPRKPIQRSGSVATLTALRKQTDDDQCSICHKLVRSTSVHSFLLPSGPTHQVSLDTSKPMQIVFSQPF
ncbi:uncharacterized protein LOC141908180 [Tubulanus polymorphus]|uniref:uncharacterized protein LOC141908180 n=1 Tax=Tubulanus polymorphus TaxID=672921 RepID=UPI003DA4DF2A